MEINNRSFKKQNLDSKRLYLQLEDELRLKNDSYNSKTLKRTYQSVVKMTVVALTTMEGLKSALLKGD